jgi:hypothetical protein
MGNRGILHNAKNEIVSNWRHKHWVTCLLTFKNIRRLKPFSAGNYSELFFLDEATAFAAGHRPCNHCQRERLKQFKNAWVSANMPGVNPKTVRMSEIDDILHQERMLPNGSKKIFPAKLGQLPFGTMFEHCGQAFLMGDDSVHLWSFSGYTPCAPLPPSTLVNVLTPQSVVKAFEYGFRPRTKLSGC